MSNNKVDVKFIFDKTDKVLWNTFKKNEIGDVLLPFVVIRSGSVTQELTGASLNGLPN